MPAAVLEVELPEPEQVAGSQPQAGAAELVALSIRLPAARLDPQRREQLALRVARKRHAGRFRNGGTDEMRRGTVVGEGGPRIARERAVETGRYPVVARRDVAFAVSGSHRQQVAQRDRANARLGVAGHLVRKEIHDVL